MQHEPAKRAFLRGRFRKTVPMRPPGAICDGEFADACTRCGDCISACPEGIVFEDDEGFPVVNLRAGACTFCSACAEACDTGALLSAEGWNWRARADTACISTQGITCRSCEDHCDNRAIRFRLQPGGRSEAEFDTESCVGCGACAAACPAGAITFFQVKLPDGELAC